MGKGQIAHNKPFLLFPQCFQKACFPGASKGVIVWEWVKRTQAIGALALINQSITILDFPKLTFNLPFTTIDKSCRSIHVDQCAHSCSLILLCTLPCHVVNFCQENCTVPLTFQSDRIFVLTKLIAFADVKVNIAKMMISVFDRLVNTVGKGENAG